MTAPLVKDDTFTPTTVCVSVHKQQADAHWYTADGYVVYRTGRYRYWVADKDGHWACQSTLADVHKDIEWLRARGR
jgi:hypothetical protein